MSSLRDVAAAAGVSRMTVSNVINGHHHKVSPATITRVRQAIKDLEYVPDAQARSLAANRSRMIGLVVHHPDERRGLLENPHDAILVGAVERAVTAAGYSLITASSADVVGTARTVGSWRTDGLIVYGSVADEINELERTQARPLVFLDNYSREQRVNVVGVDDHQGGMAAGQHLIELGHRRLAFAGPLGATDGVVARRLAGLRAAVADEPGVHIVQVLPADHEPRSAARVVDQFRSGRDAPTAVVAASDVLATEIVGELLDRGVDVPGLVSVLGFDDTAVCRWMRPQLTSIAQDIPAKGAAAVELLVRLIEDGGTGTAVHAPPRLPMSLVRRQSTAPPRV
ncbi:LacI family DNA-binding transcriptional regulator [Brachybacterium sp. UNK5269]|uniref:LacI family DNA-binding transcriptional regulator n=1 Tax=Brachybacterium sp. UNK5269 TaxID=3408576 RepID=UPI003BB13BDA